MNRKPPLDWLCRRGMKELEWPLQRYLARAYPASTPAEQARFRRFLEQADDQLWGWLYGVPTSPLPDEFHSLVQQILTDPEFTP
ncbi:succinate dehydrogenase assembly factor 2 [Candidatus Woesearchaeota archaeon]|nr:succinate dehydrogenase assembly factor 2 [Candidatus Woesearchaeota archaeon]